MQAGLPGHRLVALIVGPRDREAEQLPERRPGEGDDAGIRPGHARRGEPFAVECRAGDRVLKAVVETMDEDHQVAAGIGQIVDGRLAEPALGYVLNVSDRTGDVGGQVRIIDEGRTISDLRRIGRHDDIRAITAKDGRVAGQQAVRREIHSSRWHRNLPVLTGTRRPRDQLTPSLRFLLLFSAPRRSVRSKRSIFPGRPASNPAPRHKFCSAADPAHI
jgi:hypothetical protein